MLTAHCPACRHAYDVPDSLAGQATGCPECGEKFRVRAAAPRPPKSAPKPPAEPKERGVRYRCPYCGTRKKWVVKRRRTLLGNALFALLLIGGVLGLLWLTVKSVETSQGDVGPALCIFFPGALGFGVVLYLADSVFRESTQVCPECQTRLGR